MENQKNEYGPLELPSGKKIKFRAAKGIDRNNILQMVKIDVDNTVTGALLLDDYLKAKCITEIDGTPSDGGYKELFNEWLDSDISFYKLVFDEMFGNTDDTKDKAKAAAAFLLKNQTCYAGCNAQS